MSIPTSIIDHFFVSRSTLGGYRIDLLHVSSVSEVRCLLLDLRSFRPHRTDSRDLISTGSTPTVGPEDSGSRRHTRGTRRCSHSAGRSCTQEYVGMCRGAPYGSLLGWTDHRTAYLYCTVPGPPWWRRGVGRERGLKGILIRTRTDTVIGSLFRDRGPEVPLIRT